MTRVLLTCGCHETVPDKRAVIGAPILCRRSHASQVVVVVYPRPPRRKPPTETGITLF